MLSCQGMVLVLFHCDPHCFGHARRRIPLHRRL